MSRNFDGGTDSVDTPAFVNTATGGFTVSIWARPEVVTGTRILLSQRNNTGNSVIQLFMASTGVLEHRVWAVTNNAYVARQTGANAVSANTWHNVLATWDGGTTDASVQIFVDAVQVDTTDVGNPTFNGLSTDSVPVRLGSQTASHITPWDGDLAEAAIIVGVASQPQIDALARGVSVQRMFPGSASLLLYLPVWGLDDPEPDHSGNARHGTIIDTPARSDHPPIVPFSSRFWGGIAEEISVPSAVIRDVIMAGGAIPFPRA